MWVAYVATLNVAPTLNVATNAKCRTFNAKCRTFNAKCRNILNYRYMSHSFVSTTL
jgi:hypothetical protein